MLAQCRCAWYGLSCSAVASQEDLLCDNCREGRSLSACTASLNGDEQGRHRHFGQVSLLEIRFAGGYRLTPQQK